MSSDETPPPTHTVPLSGRGLERLPRAPERRVVLMFYHRDGVEVIPLAPRAGIVVGRERPASDVAIADQCLSRRHARFTLEDGDQIAVEDLGSTNGTQVGGRRVERATVKPGDVVMLGSIAVSVHVLTGAQAPATGLEGHDAFRPALEAELARATFFSRRLAVLMIRAADRGESALPRWCLRVRELLRPVDRLARYGGDTVEILLPEATPEAALELARAAAVPVAGEPPLVCGVACFPGAGASAEELVEASFDALRRATVQAPVSVASAGLKTFGPAEAPGVDDARFVAQCPAMRSVLDTARRLARSAIPVLLQGETGTGKEVLTRLIHESGPRRARPLVCVNCGAIPPTLVESTLFGHEPGAFTGATRLQKGVFEAAEGGTVLLDEIGELPAAAQVALLRVLESRRITRVASTREIEVDVRVIAATHRDLEAMCDAGTFRSDLYFRLNTMVLALPPLRARREEIAALAARFLEQAARANDRAEVRGIAPEAMALLEGYAWPGNVRELKNALEHAVVIADGPAVTARDLPERIRGRGAPAAAPSVAPKGGAAPTRLAGSLSTQLARFEIDTIVEALRAADGSVNEAARALEVPLRTLQHKIKTLGIKRGRHGAGDAGDPEAPG